MKKLTVSNPKLQANLDRIHGWWEFALVITVVIVTTILVLKTL